MNLYKSFIIVLVIGTLSACGGKDKKAETANTADAAPEQTATKEEVPGKLEGHWVIRRAEGDMAELNVGTAYVFKGDKLSFGKDGYLNPGKTIVTDSTFSFQADGNELVFYYNYHFNADTMVASMQKGSGQVFYLVKEK
jgi:hypothetical protein